MRSRSWLSACTAAVLVAPLLTVAAATASSADSGPHYTATALAPTSQVTADKAPSSRLARTDPKLLGRTDARMVPVVIKLDYDAVATYAGGIAGYAATSPSVTGRKLSGSGAERRYEEYVAARERTFAGDLARADPEGTGRPVAAHRLRRRRRRRCPPTGSPTLLRDRRRRRRAARRAAQAADRLEPRRSSAPTRCTRRLGGAPNAGQGRHLRRRSTPASGPSTRRSPTRATWQRRRRRPTARRAPATSATTR